MQVHVYERVLIDAAADSTQSEYVARILHSYPGKKGALVTEWHPVAFHASSAEAAHGKAKSWWDREMEKATKLQEARKAAGERLAAARKATA